MRGGVLGDPGPGAPLRVVRPARVEQQRPVHRDGVPVGGDEKAARHLAFDDPSDRRVEPPVDTHHLVAALGEDRQRGRPGPHRAGAGGEFGEHPAGRTPVPRAAVDELLERERHGGRLRRPGGQTGGQVGQGLAAGCREQPLQIGPGPATLVGPAQMGEHLLGEPGDGGFADR